MIQFCFDVMTKAQVDGVKELIDLCHCGYVVKFSSKMITAVAFGLQHSRNGRRLTMFIGSFHYRLTENGKVLKQVYYDNDGKVVPL